MLSPFARTLVSLAACAVAGAGQHAAAQFLYDPCCRAPRPACAVAPACAPAPVQTCYQQVPVVEYRDVQRTVQRPEYYTEYEERDVTEYRKVLENQQMQVPTVSYQTVTETRMVQKDCGRWVTNVECRPKVSPCDYDCRPDVFGALNRTAYSIRMAFTPDKVVRKQWIPNVVTQQIPVTRQVAVRSVKTVNYQTCRVVPVTTRKQVAVTRMRMVAQNVTLREPVTVMKTIAVGSGYALGPTPATAPRTARADEPATAGSNTDLQPSPQANDLGERTAIAPRNTARPGTQADPERTERRKALTDDTEDGIKGAANPPKARRPALRPRSTSPQPALPPDPSEVARLDRPQGVWVAAKKPSRVAGEWVARRKPQPAAQPQGPDLEPIILAQASPRRK